MLIERPPMTVRKRPPRPRPVRTPNGLLIVSVVRQASDTQLKITFAAPVAWNGTDVPSAFMAYTNDGFMDGCIGVNDTGADWIIVEFNAGVDPGVPWELNAAMAGITPGVAFPQNGTVS